MKLHPVLVPIPQLFPERTPRHVELQRARARSALQECATLCGAPLQGWRKSAEGAPLPQDGFFWSISHKRRWAAAVIADHPVGIDIEETVPRRDELKTALAGPEEWGVIGDESWHSFFRLWTAKEAVLKANGLGIGGFSSCVLVDVLDALHMTLKFREEPWRVEHYHLEDHIAAVTCRTESIHWCVMGNT